MVLIKEESINVLEIDYIEDYYNAFLNNQTENTAKAYKRALNLFFDKMFGKEWNYVTFKDLRKIKMIDVMKFYSWLNEQYKTNTVNKHMNGIKSFFRFLNKEFEDISEKIFDNIELKNPELDSSGWDGLDWREAIQIWEYAEENFGDEGTELSMLIKLACVTSMRLNALLELTWEKHWFEKNENGTIIHYIETIDKGKKNKKSISEKFYNELREKLGTEGKLFPRFYPNKVGNYLKRIITELNFDPRRNIKFHSFKKAGVMRALELTGNMYKAKEQGNHSSMTTAEKYYLKYKECLTNMTSYIMDEDIDVKSELDKYSKEDIIKAIEQMDDGAKLSLINILKG